MAFENLPLLFHVVLDKVRTRLYLFHFEKNHYTQSPINIYRA